MRYKSANGSKVLAVPYHTFKEKIKIMKQFEARYYIENLEIAAGVSGILYMRLKEKKHENEINSI